MKTRSVMMLGLAFSALWMIGCGGKTDDSSSTTSKPPPAAAPVKEGAGQISTAPPMEQNTNYQGGVGTKAK